MASLREFRPWPQVSAALGLLAILTWLVAPAAAQDSVTPGAIFGSGNDNGAFTIDRSSGVELGLRGKLRHNGAGAPENTFNSNGDGTYSFDPGVAPTQSFPVAEWSFEWSINSDFNAATGAVIEDVEYTLMIDTDPGYGTNYLTFDPIHDVEPDAGSVCWDHSFGNNATANGGGVEVSGCRSADGPTAATAAAEYAGHIAQFNVAQNSWKPHWFIPGFDPTVEGWYDFELVARDNGSVVASTWMQIIVGEPELTCTSATLPSWDGTIVFGTAEATIDLDVPNGFKSIEIMPSSDNIVLLDVVGLSDLSFTGAVSADQGLQDGHLKAEYTGGPAPTSVTAKIGPQTQAASRFMFRLKDQAGCELQADPQIDLSTTPEMVELHDNYPNPFNLATRLSFDLPEASSVRLTVFDALGRRVTVLADGSFDAGTHGVTFNADLLPSGLYLYRIEAGAFTQTKRMLLLK